MLSLQEYKQSKSVKGLVQKMFEARQISNICHLKSKSFSEHKALGSYYDSILELIDNFVETYQGQYGILTDYEIETKSIPVTLEYLEDCNKFFIVGRDALEDSHLKNIMDEVIALTYRTIYKLKFLK
jgi:hypothetical protein